MKAEKIIDDNTFVKDGLITVKNAIKCMEQYANARVAEVLEEEVENAHTEGQAYMIRLHRLNQGRYPIASVGYYETEVAPKYKKQ